ncbi:hypothetical protein [Lelliottia wanjuensis]|uniref:hypothetical protein n=1 Tax=Lelliottia wanjuensis TaxID=3050585 RepID=UPI00254B8B7B|nr:hypothetical protein [Lelliottia sp. V86_10]MDK9586732.1 hypothetical protein [Lelliottia sp. V86_10]
MTMPQTQLQQSRRNDQAQTNLSAAQQYDVNPNQGSVVPNVMQTQSILEAMMAEKNKMPNVNPPSEDEIQETMWISSGLIGLLGAIVSGNPAGGIAAGMTAALAIHDRGYDLRQRSEYVMELHNKGYSGRAILNWYETGDNKELDKETDDMQRMASDEARNAQQKEFHADDIEQREADRAQRSQDHRETMSQQYALAQLHEEGANRRAAMTAAAAAGNADRADARLQKQEQTQFDSEMKKSLEGPKQKLQYVTVAEEAYKQLRQYIDQGRDDLIPGAFNNLNHALARVQVGGGATLTDEQVQHATGLLSFADKKANDLGIIVNGRPTEAWMSSVGQQITDDKKNESKAIMDIGHAAYQDLVESGKDPVNAHKMVTRGMVGTAMGLHDWGESETDQQPAQQDQKTPPAAPPQAVAYLKAHPESASDFKAKYGYLPEGY